MRVSSLVLTRGVCCILLAAPAAAQTLSAGNNADARLHFQDGVKSAQRGDLRKALGEFEAAYAAQPNFTVLYNIGQAHSTLGHAVEAVAAFQRYLDEGGTQINAPRREEVRAAIAANRERIGSLRINLDAAPSARVWIDGTEVSAARLEAAQELVDGSHSILYMERGCPPVSAVERVIAGTTVVVPLRRPSECQKSLGQLAIDCDVPDVQVEVVGIASARTPLDAPLMMPIGEVTVRFRRSGYAEVSRRASVKPSVLTRVACQQHPLQPLPASLAARLVVNKSPDDAQVVVDGQAFTGGFLPAGPHQAVIEREGYVTARRTVSLEANRSNAFSVVLTETPEHRERVRASHWQRKRVGMAIGGAGIAFLGTAGGLSIWNSQRYTDWRDNAANGARSANVQLATSVQRIDDLSLACALLGASLTGVGAWMFFAH